MGGYIPGTKDEQAQMLARVGVDSLDALYRDVPQDMLLQHLDIPQGLGEMAAARQVSAMADKNIRYRAIFRGAGAYNHYIPAIVKSVTGKEEFVTSYTPYQAEISQGILQSIFEYQSMICQLTGMDVSNASVYDGGCAAAEAVAMCVDRRRDVAVVAESVNPQRMAVIQTYLFGSGATLVKAPLTDGKLDKDLLLEHLDGRTACVYLESPNFYGLWEDAAEIADMVHACGAKLILGVHPIASALYKTAGELGADICVGEGQPLGMPLAFGGPYLGFMATRQALMRKLPGRIVGETTDSQGNRAYVLTLQAREQHIRREKASSNICSNQALCAMTAAVYMAAMGPQGMAEAARQCHAKAVYLASQLAGIGGFDRAHSGAFFNEFVTHCPVDQAALLDALERQGILGPLPVADGLLWCATEMNSRQQIDQAVQAVKEAVR